jgi:hypothetical protein
VSPLFSLRVQFHLLHSSGRGCTYALVVDDLDDGSGSASVWAGVEEDDTADLDQSPVAGGSVWADNQ